MTRNNELLRIGLVAFSALLFFSISLTSQGQGGGREPRKPSVKPVAPDRNTSPPKRNTATRGQLSCTTQSRPHATGRFRIVSLNGGMKLELVEIPSGSFCMGSTNGEEREKPVHRVTIGYSFYMGKHEVTQAQWQSVMGNNPSNFKTCGNCPVEYVSWNDVQEFIRKMNQMNDGYTYRLPSEAEWEYACRAGTTENYAGNVDTMSWYGKNSGYKTHPVGQKRPNAWGLADMHGNVMEWCEDWHRKTYDGAPTDGSAWLSASDEKTRVIRGGAWYHDATLLRSASRAGWAPQFRDNFVGFRVVAVARTQ